MMASFNNTLPSTVSAQEENQAFDNDTLYFNNTSWCYDEGFELAVTSIFTCVLCILGLLGNGAVIWLLGFCMKRTPVTTYILNLAVADFGVLIFGIQFAISLLLIGNCIFHFDLYFGGFVLYHFMFSISQFLLTIISMDRCVSVLFPIWYRCHRPERLSTVLCALIWIFAFLVYVIHGTLVLYEIFDHQYAMFSMFLVDSVVCLPFITTSSLILVIRFCFKKQQRQRRKLLTAILLALFFFLFLAFPLNVMFMMDFLMDGRFIHISLLTVSVGHLFASVNSLVNPLIYFLVGRKKSLCTENLKLVFQRVFKQEEETYGEGLQLPVQTPVSAQLHRTVPLENSQLRVS